MKLTVAEYKKLTSKQNKYGNIPTSRKVGDRVIKFQSQKEATHYDTLRLRLLANEISDLRLQPQFTLQESYITAEGERIQAIRYTADFSYKSFGKKVATDSGIGYKLGTGGFVVEDVKGGNATKTATYRMKKKLMQERLGIRITEV